DTLATAIPASTLALPGHGLPFRNVPGRIEELKNHHASRCDQIREACRVAPLSVAELVPMLFHRALDPQQISFAFSEILAHVNYLLRQGLLDTVVDDSSRVRFFPTPVT
ncbi:MAG: MBL fold metallo-hydrolase, partial [Pseudolabrys sp.]|nr:MBL fold metallo-hydrolase [Pseudolabrys sp.]